MKTTRWRLGLMLASALPLACSVVTGLDDFSLTTGAGGAAGGTGGAAGAAGAAPPAPWWDGAFSRRIRIVFDNAGAEALADFPVMIRLDPSRIDYADTAPGGADLRFVDGDGSTVLPHEIERWSPGGASYAWVRVPSIDAGSTTDEIWLYYGNPAAPDGQAPAEVWPGFLGVYHLGAAPFGHDSSPAAHEGVTVGAALVASGQIAGALNVQGAGRVEVPQTTEWSVGPTDERTVELWFNTSTTVRQFPFSHEGDCKSFGVDVGNPGTLVRARFFTSTDACMTFNFYSVSTNSTPYADGAWHYVALVVDRPQRSTDRCGTSSPRSAR